MMKNKTGNATLDPYIETERKFTDGSKKKKKKKQKKKQKKKNRACSRFCDSVSDLTKNMIVNPFNLGPKFCCSYKHSSGHSSTFPPYYR